MTDNIFEECKIANVLQIESLYTWFRQRFASDYAFKGESHDFTEVVCVLSGKVGVTADKNAFTLSAGQLVVHSPNEYHSIWSAVGEPEVLVCSFKANAFPCGSGVFSLLPDEVNALCDVFADAKDVFEFDGIVVSAIKDGKEVEASAVVKRLERVLIEVVTAARAGKTEYSDGKAQSYYRIVSAMEEYIYKPLTTDSLAALCGMSVSALEKTVHMFTGTGAMELFGSLKVKLACKLLEQDRSVKDVSYTLGYSNPYYFSAVFKKRTGVPPSKWTSRERNE